MPLKLSGLRHVNLDVYNNNNNNNNNCIIIVFLMCSLSVCKTLLTLPPFTKVTASSQRSYKRGSSCRADDAHVIANKAWCAKDNNGLWSVSSFYLSTGIFLSVSIVSGSGTVSIHRRSK